MQKKIMTAQKIRRAFDAGTVLLGRSESLFVLATMESFRQSPVLFIPLAQFALFLRKHIDQSKKISAQLRRTCLSQLPPLLEGPAGRCAIRHHDPIRGRQITVQLNAGGRGAAAGSAHHICGGVEELRHRVLQLGVRLDTPASSKGLVAGAVVCHLERSRLTYLCMFINTCATIPVPSSFVPQTTEPSDVDKFTDPRQQEPTNQHH